MPEFQVNQVSKGPLAILSLAILNQTSDQQVLVNIGSGYGSIFEIYYNGVRWAAWRFKSPGARLLV